MANILTSARIICGLLILIFPIFSKVYYILYTVGGLTDMVDGTVARTFGEESSFGEKFDTLADFIFSTAVLLKITKSIKFPIWILLWIALIIILKFINVIIGYTKNKNFVTIHSIINKVCGAVIFFVPLFIGMEFSWEIKMPLIIIACIFANIAAIDETIKILKSEFQKEGDRE